MSGFSREGKLIAGTIYMEGTVDSSSLGVVKSSLVVLLKEKQ